jgi:uncharacterized protein with PIN domain
MLGTLAKWLRICGFDTFYATSDIDDDELIEIAKNENRILITRDKTLIQQARRENLKVIKIIKTDIDEQLRLVLHNIDIDKNKVLSRCLLCNSKIDEIKKEDIQHQVPKRVFNYNEKFWFCHQCNKIYWNGTHYDKMIEKIFTIIKT